MYPAKAEKRQRTCVLGTEQNHGNNCFSANVHQYNIGDGLSMYNFVLKCFLFICCLLFYCCLAGQVNGYFL